MTPSSLFVAHGAPDLSNSPTPAYICTESFGAHHFRAARPR